MAAVVASPILVNAGSERERATRMGVARISVGTTLFTAGIARRLFGVPEAQDNPAVRLTARLAGIRNVVLGAWTLASRDGSADERRRCYQLNAAVDAADVVVLAAVAVAHPELRRAALMGLALGGSALLGWVALLDDVG